MPMAHKTVVRNMAYQTKSFTTVERHNERKNENYFNSDVELERAKLNIYYKRNFREDGAVETYQETFDRLLEEGKIVKRGTKPDAKLFCELVYDINTSYFDERGGYDFAKQYFEETYRQAVKEIGNEDYIISAVMHADEKNSRLSEQLGRDVYHYHLHVVYVPVVQKEILWSKRTKDKSLVGKVRETIPQISQSKKWPLRQEGERDGKTIILNSYSFLQDRYHEHMKAAGYDGFERGERGSTTEHLEVLDYKIQQDKKHAEVLAAKIQEQESTAVENEKRLAIQEKKIKSMKGKVITAKQIESIPVKISRPLLGGDDVATVPKKDWDNVKKTALTQAQTDEQYQSAVTENTLFKKEKKKWRRDELGYVEKIKALEVSTKQDFMERATREAELYNLKNEVARIPKEIWNSYTKPKSQQKNHQQEVR